MANDTVLLRCPACKTVNRVPVRKLGDLPRCGKCRALLEFPGAPVAVTASGFAEEILQWPGAVLAEFWSPTCGVCRSLEPDIYALARRRSGRLKVATINVLQESSLANRFQIRAVPLFLLYRHGIKVGEMKGGLPKAQLEAWIDSLL